MKTICVVHHSFTPKDLPVYKAEKSFNDNHKARGFPKSASGWYIGYHIVIYGNGEVRKYRADDEVGAHTKEQNMNFKSIGICLSGNFDLEQPNPQQVESLTKLLRQYNFKEIYPHRHFAPYKSCYGKLLSDDWAKNLLGELMNQTKVVLSKDGQTVYVAWPVPDIGIEGLKKIANVQGFEVPDPIPPSSSL